MSYSCLTRCIFSCIIPPSASPQMPHTEFPHQGQGPHKNSWKDTIKGSSWDKIPKKQCLLYMLAASILPQVLASIGTGAWKLKDIKPVTKLKYEKRRHWQPPLYQLNTFFHFACSWTLSKTIAWRWYNFCTNWDHSTLLLEPGGKMDGWSRCRLLALGSVTTCALHKKQDSLVT